MPNYSKGQIYSIRFYDNDNHIYIGSTVQPLSVRFGGHKRNVCCSLYQYIHKAYNGDFNVCYIELIENFECSNKQALNKREGEMIRQYKADEKYIVINKNIAGRTGKEYINENTDKIKIQKQKYREEYAIEIKEYNKEYYEKNKEKIQQNKKQYRQENPEKNKATTKKYKDKNKDMINEYNKQYYQENKYKLKLKNEMKKEVVFSK